MRVRRFTSYSSTNRDKCNSRRGFTMVELIVVLIIIAILASVGVVSLVSYIRRSNFDENSQNAISVYQAASNAVTSKIAGGTIDEWTREVLNVTGDNFTDSEIAGLSDVNYSIHKTTSLTYNPRAGSAEGSQDRLLSELLTPYFYDMSVFSGTMAIKLDVSMTMGSDGEAYYSASVIAAYYCKQNTGDSGWDSVRLGNNWDYPLPQAEPFTYRQTRSLVGYFDGSEESVVGPVSIPHSIISPNETDFMFTVRNGETLDITWSIFENAQHNSNLSFTLIDEDNSSAAPVVLNFNETACVYNKSGDHQSPTALTYIDGSMFPSASADAYMTTEPVVTYEHVVKNSIPFDIKRTSVELLASVSYNGRYYAVPLTISYVEGDRELGFPDQGYLSYTLSLDCMMVRNDYEWFSSSSADREYLYSSFRFFGDSNPHNISVKIEGTASGSNISSTFATRAINDPVYSVGTVLQQWADGGIASARPTYNYNTIVAAAARDTSDKAVVNTLFGDKVCNSNGVSVSGSFSGTNGGYAVISSYRHLSNIRMVPDSVAANFIIVNDLNWYEEVGGQYVSQVRVYKDPKSDDRTNAYGYSSNQISHRVVEANELKVVSFPALEYLSANKILTSVPHSSNDVMVNSVINNVQMRTGSFNKNRDNGYGLIGENRGTIYNIYTNNISLVMYDVKNGSPCDYVGSVPADDRSILPSDNSVEIKEGKAPTYSMKLNNKPVGGLVGLNTGNIGNVSGVDDATNTVRMSNSVVMAGEYWVILGFSDGVGGVIGKNDGNTYGFIEIDGSFAVLGQNKVGGVIGNNIKNINARIAVNSPDFAEAASAFTFPNESMSGKPISCVVGAKYTSGGAIGYFENSTIAEIANNPQFTAANVNTATGAITYSGRYQIDVNLPVNSLVLSVPDTDTTALRNCGGAVGYMSGCSGYISINVVNNGDVVLYETDRNTAAYCGGAIGFEKDCSSTLFVNVVNAANTVIGPFVLSPDSTAQERLPDSTGGAIGYMQTYSGGRTVAVNITNGAAISAKSAGDNNGVGGAVGLISANSGLNALYISVTNTGAISGGSYVGGSIGNIATNYINSGCVFTTLNAGSSVRGSANYVGGAVGSWISGTLNGGKINTTITSGTSVVGAANYVGGSIGNVTSGAFNSGIETTINSASSVAGVQYVGGGVGNFANGTISGGLIENITDSAISGTSYVGGAVGLWNGNSINGGTLVNLSSSNVSGSENNVGGSFGNIANGTVAGGITGSITGSAVSGAANVGGAVGQVNNSSTVSGGINVSLSGSAVNATQNYCGGLIGIWSANSLNDGLTVNLDDSDINGAGYVGGSIGSWSSGSINGGINTTVTSYSGISGTSGNVGGSIGSYSAGIINGGITTLINSGSAVNGASNYVGGAIGSWTAGDINNGITTTVNSYSNVGGNANSVGGSIGAWLAGSVNNGTLTTTISTGSTVSGLQAVGGTVGSYSGGQINNTINNTVTSSTISGTSEVGGAIGKLTGSAGINGSIVNVISSGSNVGGEANYVGGTIGTWTAGSINGSLDTTIDSGSRVDGNDKVGGTIGYFSAGQLNSGAITENITSSFVTGETAVGGAIGEFTGSAMINGGISVNLEASYIGDIPSTNTSTLHCIDVGGVIGFVNKTNNLDINNGRIVIHFDETSQVYAGGSIACNNVALTAAGVGGAFGRYGNSSPSSSNDSLNPGLYNWNNSSTEAYVEVLCPSINPSVVSLYSNNTGGMIGHMFSGTIQRSFSTAVVQGKDYVGGLIGSMESGKIETSYSGGHTVSGQYAAGYENIRGNNFVGGFIGYASGSITTISQCYSTCSVSGSDYLGGFLGYIEASTSWFGIVNDNREAISDTYSTGLVTSTNSSSRRVGAYAGYVARASLLKSGNTNKVLNYINGSMGKVGDYGNWIGSASDSQLRFVEWDANHTGNGYIRVSGQATTTANPFDSTLDPSAYPLRPYLVSGSTGVYYGDWPTPISKNNRIISTSNIRVTFNDSVNGNSDPTYIYSTNGVTPSVKVEYKTTGNWGSVSWSTLTENSDYVISVINNDSVGTAQLVISGTNNNNGTHSYGGAVSFNFTIIPLDITSATCSFADTLPNVTYTGSELTPDIKVLFNNEDISSYMNFEYSNNINVGTATVKITPKNDNFVINNTEGYRTFTFDIAPKVINNLTDDIECHWTGNTSDELTVVSVTINGESIDMSQCNVVKEAVAGQDGTWILRIAVDGNYKTADGAELVVLIHTVTFVDELGNETLMLVEDGMQLVNPPLAAGGWYTSSEYLDEELFDIESPVDRSFVLYAKPEEVVEETNPTDPTDPTDSSEPSESGSTGESCVSSAGEFVTAGETSPNGVTSIVDNGDGSVTVNVLYDHWTEAPLTIWRNDNGTYDCRLDSDNSYALGAVIGYDSNHWQVRTRFQLSQDDLTALSNTYGLIFQ